jgi:hypothetical protein
MKKHIFLLKVMMLGEVKAALLLDTQHVEVCNGLSLLITTKFLLKGIVSQVIRL